MKRLLLVLSFVVPAACAGAPQARIAEPEVDLVQLVGPADLNYPQGDIEVQFGLRVLNRSGETIRLRQVEMSPVGSGGPYRVWRRMYYFNQEIGPNETRDVSFWARASAEGNAGALDATAPVSVRAIARFESAEGSVRKILTRTFGQQGRGPRRGD